MNNEQKLELKLKESYAREEFLENELRELGRRKFHYFNEEECWIFQEEGDNYLDSLCCPVIIAPERLVEIRNLLTTIDTTEELKSLVTEHDLKNLKDMLEDK